MRLLLVILIVITSLLFAGCGPEADGGVIPIKFEYTSTGSFASTGFHQIRFAASPPGTTATADF
jgi:hypothetical protein